MSCDMADRLNEANDRIDDQIQKDNQKDEENKQKVRAAITASHEAGHTLQTEKEKDDPQTGSVVEASSIPDDDGDTSSGGPNSGNDDDTIFGPSNGESFVTVRDQRPMVDAAESGMTDIPLQDVPGLRGEFNKRLNTGACRDKLNALLKALGKKFKNKKAGLTGIDALAESFFSGDRPLLEKTSGHSNYDSGTGALTMNMSPDRGKGFANGFWNAVGSEFIHELIHAASKSSFSHEDIVKRIAKIEGLDFKKLKKGQEAEDKKNGTPVTDSSLFEAPMNAWINFHCGGDASRWSDYTGYK
jgi:hypothetical protein